MLSSSTDLDRQIAWLEQEQPAYLLSSILGRQRNMLTIPGGRQHWPSFPVSKWAEGLPVRQFQFVQSSDRTVEARLVVDRPLSDLEERRTASAIQQCLTHPFDIVFSYHVKIPRSKDGKFEDFISLVDS